MAIPALPATPKTVTFPYGPHSVTLETGHIARQASGTVVVRMDDTVVLVTAVAKKEARPDRSTNSAAVSRRLSERSADRRHGDVAQPRG